MIERPQYGLTILWPVPARTHDVAWQACHDGGACWMSGTHRATSYTFAKERRLKRVVKMLTKDSKEKTL